MKITESTPRLIRALNGAKTIDLEKLYASALNVAVTSYTADRTDHVETVTIPAEFFAPVRDALIEALNQTLCLRRESLERDLRDVNKALNGTLA